jgi:uridine kinase
MVMIIGIAGGSGSGKTTFAQMIADQLPTDYVHVIDHDSYYHDLSHLPQQERELRNFDHPDSLETSLLCDHLKQLKNGESIRKPLYEFSIHCRSNNVSVLQPRSVIIVEGILTLADERLRSCMDAKFFVDSPDDLRLARRIDRDVRDRKRRLDHIISQYLSTVRPAYAQFVNPSKEFADFVVNGSVSFEKAVNLATHLVRSFVNT